MTEAVSEQLYGKVKILNERLWERRAPRSVVDQWLQNFDSSDPSEALHALHLLSEFIYFGDREIRELLKALYRDHYKYGVIEAVRRNAADTLNGVTLTNAFSRALAATRFLGMGNPSESGTHLLYYFRQENRLPKSNFVSVAELFDGPPDGAGVGLAEPHLERLVFVDDLCGSGSQAILYSKNVLSVLRRIQARRGSAPLHLSYHVLLASSEALQKIRDNTEFDVVSAAIELDSSHRSLEPDSRHYRNSPPSIDRLFARNMAERYGGTLWPQCPLGWADNQLLLGFHHNVPDNTLPIIWWDEPDHDWTPVFRRYPKLYQ